MFLPFILFLACFFFGFNSDNYAICAKPATNSKIVITSGTTELTQGNIGQEIEFSGNYSSQTQGSYEIYVCKSKNFNTANMACQKGYWCASNFSEENPLSCKYTITGRENADNDFFMFTCNQNRECSTYFPGSFSTSKNILGLQAPEKACFKTVNFSFLPQKSSSNDLGRLVITNTGKQSAWSINLSASEWKNEKGDPMVYDGDGISSGQMTVNLNQAVIESQDSTAGITIGQTASFSDHIKNINIANASAKNKGGIFTIKNIKLDQFIPGNQKEGNYKAILVFTIS